MFQASQRRAAGSGANRWLLLAGLGLLVLGLVLRMMLDIGAVGGKGTDTAGTAAVDTAAVDTAAVGTAAVDSAAVSPAASPTAAPPTAPAHSGAFIVQLGLFSRQANAEGIRTRAAALGYSATVYPMQRGERTLYRVSVDGMPTMDAAKQAADSLGKALGVEALASSPQ